MSDATLALPARRSILKGVLATASGAKLAAIAVTSADPIIELAYSPSRCAAGTP